MAYKTSNPALNESTFRDAAAQYAGEKTMTLEGTATKTMLLVLLVIGGAAVSWHTGLALTLPAAILGFVMALVTIFKPNFAPVTSPIYAILEGVALGGLSAMYEQQYPGIVNNSLGLTFATLGGMMFLYRSGMIKVTDKLRMGIVSATLAICLVYLVDLCAGLFFGTHLAFLWSNGPIGILISLVIVGVAALNLVLDFDFIETTVAMRAPKYMEWYGAFGLIVTLVWLYLEILRLLSKIYSRR